MGTCKFDMCFCVLGNFCGDLILIEYNKFSMHQCSQTCGSGVRQRYLVCKRVDYRGNTIATRDKYCKKSARPKVPTEESCKLMVCSHKVVHRPKWKVSPWSQVRLDIDWHILTYYSTAVFKSYCFEFGIVGNFL